jgi:tRNA dimethylallyltransferase
MSATLGTSILCLMGPTASGKSALSLAYAKTKKNIEIINVDSALVYRELTIGAAKPTPEELAICPHHLVNIRSIDEPYSAAQFVNDALAAIATILARGNQPVLVGGTMMYFKALQQGLSDVPASDPSVRARILAMADATGWPSVHARLQQCDPIAAARIHCNDAQRIERALEIVMQTGKTQTEIWQQSAPKAPSNYTFINAGLIPVERAKLHARIKVRFMAMLEQGFVEEVRTLKTKFALSDEWPAMRSVGYRQVLAYLNGEYDYETMVEKSIIATRQLAKRQLTWLRSWPGLHTLSVGESSEEVLELLTKLLGI